VSFDIFKIPPGRVTPEARLVEDLNFDALDTHELAMALEEVLSLEIHSEDMLKLHTVGELVDYLSNNAKPQGVLQGS
jgi:acyl carrier protein